MSTLSKLRPLGRRVKGLVSPITVKLLWFAQLRDRLGGSELEVALPAGATGRHVMEDLSARYPAAEPLLRVCRLAVNAEYVGEDVVLRDGDEVVVIPPVGGG